MPHPGQQRQPPSLHAKRDIRTKVLLSPIKRVDRPGAGLCVQQREGEKALIYTYTLNSSVRVSRPDGTHTRLHTA
jgi:hypothetical protein